MHQIKTSTMKQLPVRRRHERKLQIPGQRNHDWAYWGVNSKRCKPDLQRVLGASSFQLARSAVHACGGAVGQMARFLPSLATRTADRDQ